MPDEIVTGQDIKQFVAELGNAWDTLQVAGAQIAEAAEKLEDINDALSGNPARRTSIREDEKSIYRGIYDLQAEAWVMIANLYASAGLEPPEGEAKKRWERDNAKTAPPVAVIELSEDRLNREIRAGRL